MIEQGSTAGGILWGIVAENDGDHRHRRTRLASSQVAGRQIASEEIEIRVRVARIDQGPTDGDEVPDLGGCTATNQAG